MKIMNEFKFFKELLGQQSVEERKKTIDFLRDVWDFYDENYVFAAFGVDDGGRVDFLREVFLKPMLDATDEVSEELGYKPSRDKLMRQLSMEDAEMVDSLHDQPPF